MSFTNNFPTNSGFMSQFLCFITEFQSDFLIFAEVERCVCSFGFFFFVCLAFGLLFFWVFFVMFPPDSEKKELKEQKRT